MSKSPPPNREKTYSCTEHAWFRENEPCSYCESIKEYKKEITPHLKQGDKPRKVTLKEKKAYAHGYRQAYKDCRDVLTCMKCRIALSSMVEPQVFLQLIELKK